MAAAHCLKRRGDTTTTLLHKPPLPTNHLYPGFTSTGVCATRKDQVCQSMRAYQSDASFNLAASLSKAAPATSAVSPRHYNVTHYQTPDKSFCVTPHNSYFQYAHILYILWNQNMEETSVAGLSVISKTVNIQYHHTIFFYTYLPFLLKQGSIKNKRILASFAYTQSLVVMYKIPLTRTSHPLPGFTEYSMV